MLLYCFSCSNYTGVCFLCCSLECYLMWSTLMTFDLISFLFKTYRTLCAFMWEKSCCLSSVTTCFILLYLLRASVNLLLFYYILLNNFTSISIYSYCHLYILSFCHILSDSCIDESLYSLIYFYSLCVRFVSVCLIILYSSRLCVRFVF